MKSEKLLDAIGKIDDNLIYNAVHDTQKRKKVVGLSGEPQRRACA